MSVFIPNFTDWPSLIGSEVVKTITPCGVFFPVQPFSVLKDLNELSLPSQILNDCISDFPLFSNSITVVSSNPILFASTNFSSAPTSFIENIVNIAVTNTNERKIHFAKKLCILLTNFSTSKLNLNQFFPKRVFLNSGIIISKAH